MNKSRDSLVEYNNIIKIHWISSHIGIEGNEKADISAKYASYAPIILDNTLEKTDIRRYIANFIKSKLHLKEIIHPHYSNINPHHINPIYPTSVSKQQIRTFSRLRLGHTICFHQWLLKKPAQPPSCN